jgi:RHS repeat-associated protein
MVLEARFKRLLLLLLGLSCLAPNHLQSQNCGTNIFVPTGSLTIGREGQTATLLPNGMVLLVGGSDSSGNSFASAEIYNPVTGVFTPTGSLSVSRLDHTATLLKNGKVLIHGGVQATHAAGIPSLTVLNSAELYDPSTGTFAPAGNSTVPRSINTATLLSDGKVLFVGGDLFTFGVNGFQNATSLASAELYDPTTGTFSPTGSLATGRTGHTATTLPNGDVLVVGGFNAATAKVLASSEIYHLSNGTFSATGNLSTGRDFHTATLLNNGLVLVAGGDMGSGLYSTALSSAELFDPTTDVFTTTGNLSTARAVHTATLLDDGLVLVAGGRTGGYNGTSNTESATSSAELFNPASDTFLPTASLEIATTNHTATLLQNGQVLIAGGIDTSTDGITSAELYISGCTSGPSTTFLLGAPGSSTNPTASFAEPVNTATGNYYTAHRDLAVRGREPSFNFTRYYNTFDNYSGPLGAGWTHSYNIVLTEDSTAGNVTIKQGDGAIVSFSPGGAGSYSPLTIGLFDALQKNPDGSFTLTRKSRTKLNFSSTGRLQTIVDRNGNAQTLAYDSTGNLTTVTDSSGRVFVFAYDAGNHLVSITDPIGRTVFYSYGPNGNLTSYTDALKGVVQYSYDDNHRMTSATDPRGNVYLQNVYDLQGRVTSQRNARGFVSTFAYDTPSPGTTMVTDARGNTTQHVYDSFPRLIKIINAQGGTTSFTYDANNDRTSITDANGQTTTLAYDSHGNVTTLTDAAASMASFTYDAQNNLLTATDRKANTTSFSYDANGNLSLIRNALGGTTTFAYDSLGQPTSTKDAVGNVATYAYDASGNRVRITNGAGNTSVLTYDGISRLVSITDANGNTTSVTYDPLSRRTKIIGPAGNQTQFTYDGLGNLLTIKDGNANVTSYGYDATNELVRVTDALGHMTRYGYDANSNMISLTDANGHATTYAYDSLNRRMSLTDPLSFLRSYAYDSVGRVVGFTDAKGQFTKYAYDSLGRPTGITYRDGTAVSYSYDANGNRISMVDSHGTTTYAYDALNRLLSVTHPGGKVVQYAYNALGQRQVLTYPDGKLVRYGYDSANRISTVTDWLGRSTFYIYDPVGNLLNAAYPNGASVGFEYDAANRLIRVQNFVAQGKRGHEDDDSRSVPTFRYVLDAVGNRVKVIDGRGKATSYAYDSAYRLTSVTTEHEEDIDNPLDSVYTYDAVGNRLTTRKGDDTTFYSYDADDRLLSVNFAEFTYDANGNQTSSTRSANGVPITYQYDAADRLIVVTGGRIRSSFAYDGDGNRIGQSAGHQTFSYLNDLASALPVVLQEQVSDDVVSYVYGRGRISESSPAFHFFYHYDGLGSVVGLTNNDGELERRFSYDAWGESRVPRPGEKLRVPDDFHFTGEALDPGTELYYLRARYYDPEVGRFISRDPFSGFSGAPLSINGYIYARNNPTALVDHSGFVAEPMPTSPIFRTGVIISATLGSSFAPPQPGPGMPLPGPTPRPFPKPPMTISDPCSTPLRDQLPCDPGGPPGGPPPGGSNSKLKTGLSAGTTNYFGQVGDPFDDPTWWFQGVDVLSPISPEQIGAPGWIDTTACDPILGCSAADTQAPVTQTEINYWNFTPSPYSGDPYDLSGGWSDISPF